MIIMEKYSRRRDNLYEGFAVGDNFVGTVNRRPKCQGKKDKITKDL